MNKEKSSVGRIQWGRMLKKLSPYTIQKGFRYLKHYGPKEFWIRLHERFEPEEVPYGPWYEAYVPDETELEKQKQHHFEYSPLISVAVPAYRTPEKFLFQMIECHGSGGNQILPVIKHLAVTDGKGLSMFYYSGLSRDDSPWLSRP